MVTQSVAAHSLDAPRDARPGILDPAVTNPTQLTLSDINASSDDGFAPANEVEVLRRDLVAEIDSALLGPGESDYKDQVRRSHSRQRATIWRKEFASLEPRLRDLLSDFASGATIEPSRIEPALSLITPNTRDADLFRLTTLLWSVPVSRGYGRRMRFLVRDKQNGKVIGVFAIGDPVFNLRARDQFVGWNAQDRRERLANVMDAFVVGAVPPYSHLLGGKLVFSLIGSREVSEQFARRYRDTTGIISGVRRSPELTMVTVTSALGRSSLYNRLRLADPADAHRLLLDLRPIGWTSGYGHFQVDDLLFLRLRKYLTSLDHPYADGHRYGSGPNWRMRVLRVALKELGLDATLLRHGIRRQVFAMPLASNWHEFLVGADASPRLDRPALATIAEAARVRWVVPRAARDPTFAAFEVRDLERQLLLGGPG